jgi:hypothetical protein
MREKNGNRDGTNGDGLTMYLGCDIKAWYASKLTTMTADIGRPSDLRITRKLLAMVFLDLHRPPQCPGATVIDRAHNLDSAMCLFTLLSVRLKSAPVKSFGDAFLEDRLVEKIHQFLLSREEDGNDI